MAHNARILPDTYYVNGAPIPASYFQSLDTAQSKALTDLGGTWAPASAIQIAGAGVWFCGPTTLSGGAASVPITLSAPLTHGDSDYIEFSSSSHPSASRSLTTSMDMGVDLSSGTAIVSSYPGRQSVQNLNNSGVYRPGGRILLPLRVHHGATLSTVDFYFIINSAHSGVPAQLPQFRAYKVDLSGNVTPLYTGAGSDPLGFVTLNPTPTLSQYNALTSFSYSCDAGVVIDTTTYAYFAEIIDEGGTSAMSGNEWSSAEAIFTSIPDMRHQ